MIHVNVRGGHTYKVNRCTKSDKVYVYKWNSGTDEWDMELAVVGECSIVLESEGEIKRNPKKEDPRHSENKKNHF